MNFPSILLVGKTDRDEFRDARALLARQGALCECADVEEACQAVTQDGLTPDAIVFAQAFPGQFAEEAVDRLRTLVPLARTVGLLGSWCEGEVRSGKPWPGGIRVYWHQWAGQSPRELAQLRDGRDCWALPVTASEEERILATSREPAGVGHGLVLIWSPQREMQDWLAAACRGWGFDAHWLRPREDLPAGHPAAVIFDATDGRGEELEELARMASLCRRAPIIVLMDFPRAEDRRRVLAAGGAEILAKPLVLHDLASLLTNVLTP